jgi:pSer/pThr/pTyr-binding forkhead associated (FHA) protein
VTADDSMHGDRAPVVSGHAPNVRLRVARGPRASIIGSGSTCKVQLKHADVSSVHAVIVNTGEQVYLHDLVSKNGTFLNDLRAEHERLEDDDVIRIGPWHLHVALLGPPANDLGDFTGLGLDPAPSAVALENTRSGELLKLPREVNLLGRKPGCDYLVEDRSVSRAHAVVFDYISKVVVFDLASRNGIKVDGRPAVFSSLEDGGVLTVGSVDLRVKLVDSMARIKSSRNGQVLTPKKSDSDETYSDRIDLGSAELERH